MSKHRVLTEEEFASFVPPKRTTHYIEQYRLQSKLPRGAMNILDWGCGRGVETLWWREQGYNAFGVDIDPEPIRNGLGLFQRKGHPASALRVLSPEGRTDFPNDFFHFTHSNQVFEHVGDLQVVARELWRITASHGSGHHVFPAHKYLVEGHLFMPLVHWLPKNALRKLAISTYVRLGREPRWEELRHANAREKSETYYQYSTTKTFYRSPAQIRKVFESQGFTVSFKTIEHPRVQQSGLFRRLLRFRWSRAFADYLLLTFVSNELHLAKLR